MSNIILVPRNVWKNTEVCLSLVRPSDFRIMGLLVDKTISFEEAETVGSYAYCSKGKPFMQWLFLFFSCFLQLFFLKTWTCRRVLSWENIAPFYYHIDIFFSSKFFLQTYLTTELRDPVFFRGPLRVLPIASCVFVCVCVYNSNYKQIIYWHLINVLNLLILWVNVRNKQNYPQCVLLQ